MCGRLQGRLSGIASNLSRGIHAAKLACQKRRPAYLHRYPRTFASGASVVSLLSHMRESLRGGSITMLQKHWPM